MNAHDPAYDPAHDPELDLALRRIIRAPREIVWRAWTDPERLAQWFIPAPLVLRVDRLDVSPGGAFVTRMSEDGVEFTPHIDGIFLVADPEHRLAFTNALDSDWRPAAPGPVAMTAEITLLDHPDGVDYRVLVRHGSPEARAEHERLGFFDGWGTVTDALAGIAEGEARAAR